MTTCTKRVGETEIINFKLMVLFWKKREIDLFQTLNKFKSNTQRVGKEKMYNLNKYI